MDKKGQKVLKKAALYIQSLMKHLYWERGREEAYGLNELHY